MTKSIAYTPALVATITSAYLAGTPIETIAKDAGKSVPMIRSKLVAEGVYIAKAKTTKASGAVVERKMGIVQSAETILSLPVGALASFEKGTKADLTRLVEALIKFSDAKETQVGE